MGDLQNDAQRAMAEDQVGGGESGEEACHEQGLGAQRGLGLVKP